MFSKKTFTFWIFIIFLFSSCSESIEFRRKKNNKNRISKVEKLLKSGNYQDAMDILVKIRKRHKQNPKFWNMLGLALRYNAYFEKDIELRDEEIKAFKKAIKLDSQNHVYIMNLANSYWETGKKKQARVLYEKVLVLKPDHKEKTGIQERIKIPEKPKVIKPVVNKKPKGENEKKQENIDMAPEKSPAKLPEKSPAKLLEKSPEKSSKKLPIKKAKVSTSGN